MNAWTEQQRTTEYGISAVPAITINGKLKFVGVPKRDDLVKVIKQELKTGSK